MKMHMYLHAGQLDDLAGRRRAPAHTHPATGYQSRRMPKVRGDRKRAALAWANEQHAKQKKIEAAWRDGRYPKPSWAHSSATTRLTGAMAHVRDQITEQLAMRLP